MSHLLSEHFAATRIWSVFLIPTLIFSSFVFSCLSFILRYIMQLCRHTHSPTSSPHQCVWIPVSYLHCTAHHSVISPQNRAYPKLIPPSTKEKKEGNDEKKLNKCRIWRRKCRRRGKEWRCWDPHEHIQAPLARPFLLRVLHFLSRLHVSVRFICSALTAYTL